MKQKYCCICECRKKPNIYSLRIIEKDLENESLSMYPDDNIWKMGYHNDDIDMLLRKITEEFKKKFNFDGAEYFCGNIEDIILCANKIYRNQTKNI